MPNDDLVQEIESALAVVLGDVASARVRAASLYVADSLIHKGLATEG